MSSFLFFFFSCAAPPEFYSLSLHDALPIYGTMFTLALVRFPPTATKEIQYLNAKGALTYTDIAGDPVLYGNLPPAISVRSEERFSRNAETDLVCRLLLEKKKMDNALLMAPAPSLVLLLLAMLYHNSAGL